MPDTPSRIRVIASNAAIAAIVLVVVLFNLPDSAITRASSPLVNAIALPLGLDQSWALFAPTPPTRQDTVTVNVTMAGGAVRTWALPNANPIFGVPTQHRWRKLKETLITSPGTRADFAASVVRTVTAPGDQPVSVDIVLRTESIPPLGSHDPVQTSVELLYHADVAATR